MLCKIVCKKPFLKCKMLKNRAALDVSKIMSYRYSMLLGNKLYTGINFTIYRVLEKRHMSKYYLHFIQT